MSTSQPVTGWQRSVVITADRFLYWFSRHWLAVFNVVAAVYVGLPFLAPVLMAAGWTGPGRLIYTLYKPMCHQMAFRSFFLFGEQYAYPREMAGLELRPLESYVGQLPEFAGISPDNTGQLFAAARQFLGNAQMGYKLALCERDIAIYGFVLIGGLLYGLLRRWFHIKPLRLLPFIVIGMGPIGLDGFSQLFGYWPSLFNDLGIAGLATFLQSIFPLRESTPLLRVLTGGWFGLTLVWLVYPSIADGMAETAQELEVKLRRIGVLK
ncbi:MAG: DUF2085 domain-containing protein [Chloroflexota bacterium]